MDEAKAKHIVDYVFRDVFGVDNDLSLDEVRERFAFDLELPQKAKGALTGEEVWTISENKDRVIGRKAFMGLMKNGEWMTERKPIGSMGDLLRLWDGINYSQGNRSEDSTEVAESDNVYHSSSVYRSTETLHSQNIVFSNNNFGCDYLVASSDNSKCTLGVRVRKSVLCSSGFEISASNRVSKSMYVRGSTDLFECIFCSQLRSKRYCIANMQFEKDEYLKLKGMIVEWTLKNFSAKLKADLELGR
jgi:hypothetical protein